ncbi:hypothetical protein QTP86_020696, partial [Hemibagrus guttatus]
MSEPQKSHKAMAVFQHRCVALCSWQQTCSSPEGILGQAGAVPIGSSTSIKCGPHSKPTFAVFVDPGHSVTSTPQPSSSPSSVMVHQPSSVPPTSAFQPPVPRHLRAYI